MSEKDQQDSDALDKRFVDLISKNKVKIPPYPATAMRLGKVISGDDFTLQELAKIISADQVLAAAVLRSANSPVYAAARPITSLDVAIGRIGTDGVVRIAFASGLGAHASKPGMLLSLRSMVWRQSLFSAELCRAAAVKRGLKEDEAFVCGLLHDFGKVVALACLEEIQANYKTGVKLTYSRCMDLIETYHVELGLVMAAKWNLSELVSEAVSEHHRPIGSGGKMTQLIVVADQVLQLAEAEPRVTGEDLAGIPYLAGESECQVFAKQLEQLPVLVHAFGTMSPSGEKSGKNRRAPEVRVRPDQPRELGYPVDLQAVSMGEQGPCELRVFEMTRAILRTVAKAPLFEQTVVPLKLWCDPTPFEFWATVVACDEDEAGYHVDLRPIALDSRTAERWRLVFGAAQKAAAPEFG